MFAAWVIRGLTLGELDGEFTGEPREALIVATEDGREDVWKPRLQAAGADLDGVCFLDHPPDWNLRDGIDLLAHAIAENTSLLFIDAAMSHMPQARGSENVNSPTFVRSRSHRSSAFAASGTSRRCSVSIRRRRAPAPSPTPYRRTARSRNCHGSACCSASTRRTWRFLTTSSAASSCEARAT